ADLAGLFVLESDRRRERPRVGHVLLAALLDRVRRLLEFELAKDDGEVPRVVLDRGYVVNRLSQAALLRIRQLFERATLDIDQLGDFEGVLESGKTPAGYGGSVRTCQSRRLLRRSEGRKYSADIGRGTQLARDREK